MPYATNNIGVFQGIPLSAQLFISYAERDMVNYNATLDTNPVNLNELKIRNASIEYKWSNFPYY